MSNELSSGHCNECNTNRRLERKSTNHILHLFITIILGVFTNGIGSIVWIFVWILCSIKIAGWQCSICGSTKVGNG
jgi:hypothetical protein